MTPCRVPFAVTPDDATELPTEVRGLYIGTGGDLVVQGIGTDTTVTYKNLPDASYVFVQASKVMATGTTASDIIGEA
jgi:hypothetical protein